jgi:hypothetical protein
MSDSAVGIGSDRHPLPFSASTAWSASMIGDLGKWVIGPAEAKVKELRGLLPG